MRALDAAHLSDEDVLLVVLVIYPHDLHLPLSFLVLVLVLLVLVVLGGLEDAARHAALVVAHEDQRVLLRHI